MSDTHARPAFLAAIDLTGRTVLVLGGGSGAHRTVPWLLNAGAQVQLAAAEVRPSLTGLGPACTVHRGAWDDALLDGVAAVVVTGDDPNLDGAGGAPLPGSVARAARDRNIVVVHAIPEQEPEQAAPRATRRGALRAQLRGTVALVGGGPGADGLLTLRGRELLDAADVVVADRLAPQHILATLPPDCELIDAAKIPYGRQMAQHAINAVLIDRARAGKFVVRFKGGDNFLFGRGYEEALACAQAGLPCQAVPGVTSALSAPALAGIPVTHRGLTHEVTIISGHLPPGHPAALVNWQAVAQLRGTIVLLMAVSNAPAIAACLQQYGKSADTAVSVIEKAASPRQRRIDSTLATLAADMAAHDVTPPAIIVIGEVVALPQVPSLTARSGDPLIALDDED